MPLQTVEPQRLYRQIAEQLRVLIRKGEFAPGSRLPAERDLARQLGVSRPSVREALIALEVEGWVEIRTGSGIYVQSTTQAKKAKAHATIDTSAEWGPLEVMSARILVESEVAALAGIFFSNQFADRNFAAERFMAVSNAAVAAIWSPAPAAQASQNQRISSSDSARSRLDSFATGFTPTTGPTSCLIRCCARPFPARPTPNAPSWPRWTKRQRGGQ